MASIFTRIIQGEIPSHTIHQDDDFIAFLDINPLHSGHTLVVPKTEVDYVFDLEPDLLADAMRYAQRIARAIEAEVDCARIGVAVIGLEVPHAHIHLVPIHGVHDLDFKKPRVEMSQEEMADLARRIGAHLEG